MVAQYLIITFLKSKMLFYNYLEILIDFSAYNLILWSVNQIYCDQCVYIYIVLYTIGCSKFHY